MRVQLGRRLGDPGGGSGSPSFVRAVVRDCADAAAAVMLAGESTAEFDRLEVIDSAGVAVSIRSQSHPLIRNARISDSALRSAAVAC
ncbi:hypothetical protein [Streptomyces sp. 8N706]|uniref:hypothetical protein n=1 Tax=Streptomyces sp. 8N706 TaxID=3457416 RepID=UPI003FD2C838